MDTEYFDAIIVGAGQAGPAIAAQAPELQRQIGLLRESTEIDDTMNTLPDLLKRTSEGLKRIRQIVKDLRLFARLDEGEVNEADSARSGTTSVEL